MSKITPCLWFDDQAEEAANFYVSLIPGSRVVEVSRYGDAGPRPKGTVMMVAFELGGQSFQALNGGPQYTFTPAISLSVGCEDQAEVDRLWEGLGAGGRWVQCGWLTDRWGVSWQIVPKVLGDPDRAKTGRVMKAMLKMKKLDIAGLRRAYEGDY